MNMIRADDTCESTDRSAGSCSHYCSTDIDCHPFLPKCCHKKDEMEYIQSALHEGECLTWDDTEFGAT